MIKNLKIKNYRCLKDVSVQLGMFNVLTGYNGTGKSSFLDAIEEFAYCAANATMSNRTYKIFSNVWKGQSSERVQMEIENEHGSQRFVVWLENNVHKASLPVCEQYRKELMGIKKCDPVANRIASLSGVHIWPRKRVEEKTGFGIPTQLAMLAPDTKEEIRKGMCMAFPDIVNFEARKVGDVCDLKFEMSNGLKVDAEHASQGMLLMLYWLTLAYTVNEASLLLIENPEKGLHYKLHRFVAEVLRSITLGNNGLPAVQVICTTHSPYFLDALSQEQKEIFLFQKGNEDETVITNADAKSNLV